VVKMSRESWVYPADGSPPYRKGTRHETKVSRGVAFLPDLPDFVSPIDGRTYSGRAGMREHNKRHDVVPNEDLKGLPTLTANSDTRSPEEKRYYAEQRKRLIIDGVYKHVYGVD
jgi:hypothetical protein